MKVFLDDVRTPIDCASYMHQRIGSLNPLYLQAWVVVKNYDEFVKVVTKNIREITHISLDHDLADEHYRPSMYNEDMHYSNYYSDGTFKEKTGYDCAVWMKDFYKEHGSRLPMTFVHSMNPAGTQNIINVFR